VSVELTTSMIDQALDARLAEIHRTLPPERQDAAVLQAHAMAGKLRDVLRAQRTPRCEVSKDGRSFRCY